MYSKPVSRCKRVKIHKIVTVLGTSNVPVNTLVTILSHRLVVRWCGPAAGAANKKRYCAVVGVGWSWLDLCWWLGSRAKADIGNDLQRPKLSVFWIDVGRCDQRLQRV